MLIPRIRTLQKFTLKLKDGEASFSEKSITIPENLTIRIRVRYSTFPLLFKYPLSLLSGSSTRLLFEPLNLSPFHQIRRVEKHLSYHEKRRLAEQLSSTLKIQLIDMLSSFEPGVYESNQNFAEKLKFVELEPSGSSKLATSKNNLSIQLPYEKELVYWMLSYLVVAIVLIFNFGIRNLGTRTTNPLIIFSSSACIILAIFLPQMLRFPIRTKIVVSGDHISLIRQNIWGARTTFHSNLSKLKDISIIPATPKTSRIVFRSDKQAEIINETSKEVVVNATTIINNLLVNRRENIQAQ